MKPELSWWLLLPLLLSLAYGCVQTYATLSVNLPLRNRWVGAIVAAAGTAAITLSWSMLGYSLPILYITIYLVQIASLLVNNNVRTKNWFMVNLSCANALALHLILIGVAALAQGTTMYALLADPFWRLISISVVLVVYLVLDIAFLCNTKFAQTLSAEAESPEAASFMGLLFFCVVYLLVDSSLCIFELEPLYPPLFLVGSSAVVLFTLARFLLHINTLIKNHHLKEEHDRLTTKLEESEESADILRRLTQRDALTGAYSRRYAMTYIDTMVKAGTSFSLVFMDIDKLKMVNDTQGHDAGDAYLCGFTKTLRGKLRNCDFLARLGGDEFVVLMPGCSAGTAGVRIEKIRDSMEQDEQKFPFSYGVVAFENGNMDAAQLIRKADQAMYRDKMRRHQREGWRHNA